MTTTPDAESTTARYQQKRERVLSHAAVLFNEHGLKSTTLASIAESVGLATNSVTYYYRKKEDLAHACLMRSMAAFERVHQQAATHAQAHERVRACLVGHAQLQAAIALGEHPPLMHFSDMRAMPDAQARQLFAAYADVFRSVRALIDAPEQPRLHSARNARAHLLLSLVQWMSLWLVKAYEPAEFTRVAHRVADFLLLGVSPPAKPRSSSDADSDSGATPTLPRCVALAPILNWQPTPHPDPVHEAFLHTATVLLNEQGYRGASIEKIAGRLKRSKGAFYHHNDHKQDLISACFERTFEQLRQALSLAQREQGSGRDRLFSAALALVRFQASPSGPMLYSSAVSALPSVADRQQASRSLLRLSGRMAALLVDGMGDGSVRPMDSAIGAQVVMSSVMAGAELKYWVREPDVARMAEHYVRPLFDGLLS